MVRGKAGRNHHDNHVKSCVGHFCLRFGLPGEIISDNGKQFRDNPFKDWCEKLRIRQCFAFVKHLQANGLVERANRSLEEGIKARLDERSKDWIEELPHVLWAHRTMIKSSNEETHFTTYGRKHERKREKQQFKRQKARKRWKSITTQESAAQVSSRATWSTAAMKQVMPGTSHA
ncbi:reverse transcriptase domain-containing protein [Tanacetum coccineum]